MDQSRSARLVELFRRDGCDAVICRAPQHVLMLTGYLPILGNSFCMVSLNGSGEPEVRLVIPKDEEDLVPAGTAVDLQLFAEETMHSIENTIQAARGPLADVLAGAGLPHSATIGYEGGCAPIATAYTQVGVAGPATLELLREVLPSMQWREATSLLNELAAIKTEHELAGIRLSEEAAVHGFKAAREAITPGATEAGVAAAVYGALLRSGHRSARVQVLPHVHVMSGPRAALAYRAFNLTSNRAIEHGDPVTIQLEIGIDGYWAELTRTFFAGDVSEEWRRAHSACVGAQKAALAVIRDGLGGREADETARAVMRQAGFGDAFKHGLGHGIGLQAINHGALPKLHPASNDVLRTGMVHNVEPAVYFDGKGGLRLNDNVHVQAGGNEVLSSAVPRDLDWLVTP
ncbi:MAG TPA: Xaa-Pro peptidase family protein [Chloroflexota bacterium]|nr:Xaa-Pro peptidase family protein [Chloroflexota bacterium]